MGEIQVYFGPCIIYATLIRQYEPQYIFVDRSEDLVYEDFSWLYSFHDSFKIFDASQYLGQIITGKYAHPFTMGFDILLSTLYKNYFDANLGISLICISTYFP